MNPTQILLMSYASNFLMRQTPLTTAAEALAAPSHKDLGSEDDQTVEWILSNGILVGIKPSSVDLGQVWMRIKEEAKVPLEDFETEEEMASHGTTKDSSCINSLSSLSPLPNSTIW